MRAGVRWEWILPVVLAAGCAAKQQAAHPPAPPSPSPGPTATQVATTAETQPGALTPDEQRDALDRKLGDSLSAFDAMLLKEQKEVAEKRAEQQPAGGTGNGGEGSSGGGKEKAEQVGETSGQKTESDRSTGSSRSGSASKRGGRTTVTPPEGAPPASGSSVPRDVGDGRDDDVVARQIREAAMKERDPAIREKLWEEYRRYKGIRKGES